MYDKNILSSMVLTDLFCHDLLYLYVISVVEGLKPSEGELN